MNIRTLVLLAMAFIAFFGCRDKEIIATGDLNLRFSVDTLYLDTVFETIGSSTYTLKVFNDQKETVKIGNVRLENPASPFRLNVNGTAGSSVNNVEILANDSIYIFVEVTSDVLNSTEYLVTDKIIFSGDNSQQEVDLVTLAKQAIFHKPQYFIVVGTGSSAITIPYSIIDCNTTWDASVPHIIYGYAVVDSACNLNISAGADIHFHENSGLWVFNGGELKVADGLFPGQGDSVTFSGDRLEPGYENTPGQWGGILGGIYIGQGGKATINNAVIKNATTALRTDSAIFSDQLIISNSYILNSSRTAFYAGYSSIEASNLVVANSGLYNLYAYGGNYEFRHCTFANYWNGSTRQEPAVLLTNFSEFIDENGSTQRIVRDLESAYFGNCIVYGNNEQEFSIAKDESGLFNFQINNALLKVATDPDDRGYDLNDVQFTNVSINNDVDFVNTTSNNYALDSNSQAVNQGNVTDGSLIFSDILGKNRNFGGIPDLGAYERLF